jgi:hypothetical protein
MSIMDDATQESNIDIDRVDLREQPYNGREIGPFERVQLPTDLITSVDGIVYDIDLHLFRTDSPVQVMIASRRKFYRTTLKPMLDRHPALAGAEVRDTGRGVHAIVWFDAPVVFNSDGERRRWAGIVQVVQAALPIDPDQPGITALTRPLGSINGKTGREVKCLTRGTPVPVADVLQLFQQMVQSPFRTLMGILLGADRVSPCPVCRVEGTSLAALDQVGRCYGSCGNVKLEQLYDVFLAPRKPQRKEVVDGNK